MYKKGHSHVETIHCMVQEPAYSASRVDAHGLMYMTKIVVTPSCDTLVRPAKSAVSCCNRAAELKACMAIGGSGCMLHVSISASRGNRRFKSVQLRVCRGQEAQQVMRLRLRRDDASRTIAVDRGEI